MNSSINNADVQELVFLTLGDGDFSWSLDLARHLATIQAQNATQQSFQLIATGIDSAADLQVKYRSDGEFALRELQRIGNENGKRRLRVQVRHEINAITDESLLTDKPGWSADLPKSNVLIFNHPHLGTEDARLHSHFLCHLFHSVHNVWLAKLGVFYLTLAKDQFERWNCIDAASRHGMELLNRYLFVPCPADITNPYYKERRHQSGKSFANRTSGSETFAFIRTQEKSDFVVAHFPSLPWFAKKGIDAESVSTMQLKPTDNTSFPCPHCDRSFREERSLKKHIQSKHLAISDNHKRKRTGHDEVPLTCTYCEETTLAAKESTRQRAFANEDALEAHIQAKHKAIHTTILPHWAEANKSVRSASCSVKLFGACHICGKEFFSHADKQVHIEEFVPSQSHAGIFICRFCTKTFPQSRAQLQHENVCIKRSI